MEAQKSFTLDETPMPEEHLAKELAYLVQNTMWVSAPEYAGWLQRRGTSWIASKAIFRKNAWKRKWISIHGTELLIMDDEPVLDKVANLNIRRTQITASTTIKEDDSDSSVPGYGFCVLFHSESCPDWYFKADTEEEKANWMIKLSQVHAITLWLSSYEKVKVLGVGAQGTVYELRSLHTGQRYAMKEIEIKNEKQMSLAVSEATFLKNIVENVSHPNIMYIEKVFQVGSKFYLVFPLCLGGELYEAVVARGHYSEHDTAVIVRDLISALHALHEHNILHLDIKPENILFDKPGPDGKILLTDFGLSKLLADENSPANAPADPKVFEENLNRFLNKGELNTESLRGTFGYMSPEVIITAHYSKASDVFASGVVLYILLCGYPPFYSASLRQTLLRTVKGHYKIEGGEWDKVSDGAKDLVKKMLEINPAKRITTAEILEHPWIMAVQSTDPLASMPSSPSKGRLETASESTTYSTTLVSLDSITLSREPTVVTMPSPDSKLSPAPLSTGPPSADAFPSVQPLSKDHMTGTLSRLANHVRTLKTTKMAEAMTKFMSSAGNMTGFSRLAQRFVREVGEAEEVMPYNLHRSLTLVTEDVRSAVTNALFNLFGNSDAQLTVEQMVSVRQRLGFVPASANSNLGDLLLLHLIDRDHDGYISAEDMVSMQMQMGQQNDSLLKAVFRIYAEAVWYPGKRLNYRHAVQHLQNRPHSGSSGQEDEKNHNADWMKSRKEGMDKEVNVVEPPKFITAKNVAAIFERLGYDPNNGKKVFEILCEAVRRLHVNTYQAKDHEEAHNEDQKEERGGAAGVVEAAEDMKMNDANKNTSQRKERMDVQDFIRAARLDNVLIQVLFRRTQKVILGVCRRVEERLRAVLAENPEVKEDVVLTMLAEDELMLQQQHVKDHEKDHV